MILCEWDAPEGHPGQCCVHLYASVSYQRLSPQFQFSLSAVTLVYLSRWGRLRVEIGKRGVLVLVSLRSLYTVQASSHSCQFLGAFIAPLPTENNILGLKSSFRHWKQIPNLFMNKRPLTDLCAPLAICFQKANSCRRWWSIFKGLSQDDRQTDFSTNLRASLF